MFQPGDLIVYGNTGVCRVESLTEEDGGHWHYLLKPIYESYSISTPADRPTVFMRPILTRQEAEELIDSIPSIEAGIFRSKALGDLAEHYEKSLRNHSCGDLVELTKSIYAKKKAAKAAGKKLGAVDERFMKRGEELLFGELAAALGIEREDVRPYIAQRLDGERSEGA